MKYKARTTTTPFIPTISSRTFPAISMHQILRHHDGASLSNRGNSTIQQQQQWLRGSQFYLQTRKMKKMVSREGKQEGNTGNLYRTYKVYLYFFCPVEKEKWKWNCTIRIHTHWLRHERIALEPLLQHCYLQNLRTCNRINFILRFCSHNIANVTDLDTYV